VAAKSKQRKPGKPEAEIDLNELVQLCTLRCTDEEIAAFFKVDVRTIERRRKKDPAFRDAAERGQSIGKLSLRRWQRDLASKGNATMLIWLGKQDLGQREPTGVLELHTDRLEELKKAFTTPLPDADAPE